LWKGREEKRGVEGGGLRGAEKHDGRHSPGRGSQCEKIKSEPLEGLMRTEEAQTARAVVGARFQRGEKRSLRGKETETKRKKKILVWRERTF